MTIEITSRQFRTALLSTLTFAGCVLPVVCDAGAPPSQMERLDRGVVAMRVGKPGAFVSWRLLGTEPQDTAFNIYRATGDSAPVKLNKQPLANGTNFSDMTADFSKNNSYTVRAVIDGQEQPPSRAKTSLNTLPASSPVRQYITIPLRIPKGGITPAGESYTYNANDCSAGDLDGDGEYEIIVKWDPSNAKDNAHDGYTGNVHLDAYKLDGTFLWRIDLGRNIRAGAHYTQFLVYDFDGDGIAEVVCKTADGTIDGAGKIIGNAEADYRNAKGRILEGPEFLTVFNGRTGAALATVDYVPPRGDVNDWGDNRGNRSERYLACTAYLDGRRPSIVMCRGYYTRAVLAAWDWRDGRLTQRWVFDSDDGTPGNSGYRGQGNHNLTVADVDGDGRDEIIYGSCTIGHDGKGLYSTGLGHGDAMHVTPMDPRKPNELHVWVCHESMRSSGNRGHTLREARTGRVLFSAPSDSDSGRALAADVDPRHPGHEMWGARCRPTNAVTLKQITTERFSQNFAVWWDGDLLREFLSGTTISKWNWKRETIDTLLDTSAACASNNGTKATPCLSADLFGDWREEVIWRTKDNRELRIYTTVIPTDHRIFTLMHDRQYRQSIAWQNVAYNQPPHPGFFLGHDMKLPPMPDIVETPAFAAPGTAKQ